MRRPLAFYLPAAGSSSLIALPVIASGLSTAQLAAVSAGLPLLYLLGDSLGRIAQSLPPLEKGRGRHITFVPVALAATALLLLLLSLVAGSPVLLVTSLVLLLYLLSILWRVLRGLPAGLPVSIAPARKRIIAGNTASVRLDVATTSAVRLHCQLRPVDPWLRVTPAVFSLEQAPVTLSLTATPPLSGPSHPRLGIWATDPWGFFQVSCEVEPLTLEVIPRAKYARWLAARYLEQAGAGTPVSTGVPPETVILPRRGTEYHDSRDYQPGDRLKDVDWKHTLKLNQLTVRDFIEAGGQTAILAADLSAADAEEVDRLAANLVTAALTLARNRIPTALAAFNHQRVIKAMPPTDPDKILRQTLRLVVEITPAEFPRRFLDLPDIGRLRRNMARLRRSASPPGRRLLAMLEFEFRALRATATNHPAALALGRVAALVSPPAIIVLVAGRSGDAEALLITLEKLSGRSYTVIEAGVTGPGAGQRQSKRAIQP